MRAAAKTRLWLRLLPLFAILGLLLLSGAHAYPMYWHSKGHASSCTDGPSAPIGRHLAPVPDTSITMEVVLEGQPVSSLCPGQRYEVVVSFGSLGNRAALLTASDGSFAESNVASCPNALTTTGLQRVAVLKATWVLPCDASGILELTVTSALAALGPLRANSASFPVEPASGCTSSCPQPHEATAPPVLASQHSDSSSTTRCLGSDGSKCEESGQAVIADPDYNSMMTAVSFQPPTDDPAAQTVGLLAASAPAPAAVYVCPASSLGYQCSQRVDQGVTIHYSWAPDGAGQPGNSCTQDAGLDTELAANNASMLHFAIESTLPGYAALGFPATPAAMVPADAVIGSVDEASGAVRVETYRLSSQLPAGVIVTAPPWATGMGVVRLPAGVTVVCFSRPLAVEGLLVPSLDLTAVPIIWAAHTSSSRSERHAMQGSLTLNMQAGRPSGLAADDSYLPLHVRYAAQIAHGVLMVLACCVLMPAGVVVARQKQGGKLSPFWFKLHQSLQQAGLVCLLASFVVAMTLFHRGSSGAGRSSSSLHPLHTPHFVMGVAVTAAVVLQAALGAARPGSSTAASRRHRAVWRAAHCTLGYCTVGLGICNSFVGVVLAHDLKSLPWLAWLLPMCLALGGVLLAGMGLEVAKRIRTTRLGHSSSSSPTHRVKARAANNKRANHQRAGADDGSPSEASAPSSPAKAVQP